MYDDSTSTPLLQFDFDVVKGVDDAAVVHDFKASVKDSRPRRLGVYDADEMDVFGPWLTQPAHRGDDVSALLQAGGPRDVLAVLAELPVLAVPARAAAGKGYFFFVRVPPPGASPLPAARACAGGRACAECGLGLG